MNKYIDLDKLIAGIKYLQDKFPVISYEALFHLINSLQQESESVYHYNWRPSEEQINALERAIIKMHTPNDIGILAELRDSLKKL